MQRRQPLFFIAGELDNVIHTNGGMEASTAALRKTCTDLRGIVYIPDCGHWNTQEKPHETNVALLGFLASTKDLGRGAELRRKKQLSSVACGCMLAGPEPRAPTSRL